MMVGTDLGFEANAGGKSTFRLRYDPDARLWQCKVR